MALNLDCLVVVALGGNLKDRFASCEALLEAALARFPAHGMNVISRSSWWRSAAWPDPEGPEYLNGVALVGGMLDAPAILAALLEIESEFGRDRQARNAPRTLDLDLIAYGRLVIHEPGLELPHPRAHQRLFVMGPLAEIAPDWVHPTLRLRAADVADQAPVGRDARPI